MLTLSLQWIRTRTGISARRVLRSGEHLRDLALGASRDAIASSGIQAKDIDLVLHATSSPDDLFGDGPWLAAELQAAGDTAPPAFDLTAACSGFVVGLVTCARKIFIKSLYGFMYVEKKAVRLVAPPSHAHGSVIVELVFSKHVSNKPWLAVPPGASSWS